MWQGRYHFEDSCHGMCIAPLQVIECGTLEWGIQAKDDIRVFENRLYMAANFLVQWAEIQKVCAFRSRTPYLMEDMGMLYPCRKRPEGRKARRTEGRKDGKGRKWYQAFSSLSPRFMSSLM
jgi:hypothetical protein